MIDSELINTYCDLVIDLSPYSKEFTKTSIVGRLEYDAILQEQDNIDTIYEKLINDGYLVEVPNRHTNWVQMTDKGISKKFKGQDPEDFTIDRILKELYNTPEKRKFYVDILDANSQTFDLYSGLDMSRTLLSENLILWKDGETFWKLSPLANDIVKKGGWLIHLNNKKISDTRVEEKSIVDLRLAKWQVKTFWWVFGFGLFGGLYSTYDFIKTLTTKEPVQQLQTPIVKKVSVQSKPHTLPLIQKNTDSLGKTNFVKQP